MTKQGQTLIRSALILTIAGLAAKVISAFYKVPLAALTGTTGISFYQAVYPVYSLLTAAALIGIPNSVSKLVAEELAREEYNKAHQTFRLSFIITSIMGLTLSVLLYACAPALVDWFNWEGSLYALRGLSIAPLFISIAGAVRGYMQGMQNMVPSAMSQIIENTFKVVIGIGLVKIILVSGGSVPKAIGGASLGVSGGLLLSAAYLSYEYLKRRKKIKQNIAEHDSEVRYSKKEIARKIGHLALPVTIASASYSIMTFIDSATIPGALNEDVIVKGMKIIAEGQTVSVGSYTLGILGKVQTVVNVPLVISVSLIVSIVPSISAANVRADKSVLKIKIREALEMATKIAVPAAVGIFTLASPIMHLVYGTREGSTYLMVYAVCLIFMILSQSLIGVLQGLSKYYAALFIVLGASATKILVNIILLRTWLEVYGAQLGTLAFYMFIVVLSYIVINIKVSLEQKIIHSYLKPLFSSLTMGVVVKLCYELVKYMTGNYIIAVFVSIIVGIVVYAVLMVVTKAFTKDEILILPKHEKLLKILEKKQLIKKD